MKAYYWTFFLFTFIAAPAHATLKAEVKWAGGMNGGDKWCGEFDDDAIILTISDNGHTITSEKLCSSYGKANAKILSDKLGHDYVLLEHSQGRGTNGNTDYLTVYQISDGGLYEMARVLLSWSTGPTHRFTYTYKLQERHAGGLDIALYGKADNGSICCVPRDKNHVVSVSTKERLSPNDPSPPPR